MSRVVLDPVFRFMYSEAMRVLAYHITWGTYGTRLHGDRRGNPETIRRLLKRWLTQELMKRWPLDGEDRTYWAECGSIRWIGDEDYLTNAVKYVADQRCV